MKRFIIPKVSLYYDLFCVVCHIGEDNAGHFVAYAKDEHKRWRKFDDKKSLKRYDGGFSLEKNEDIKALFYRKRPQTK